MTKEKQLKTTTTKTIPATTIQQWFMELEPSERAAAMGFVDGPFLKGTSRLATSARRSSSATKDEPSGGPDAIDWNAVVGMKDIDEAFSQTSMMGRATTTTEPENGNVESETSSKSKKESLSVVADSSGVTPPPKEETKQGETQKPEPQKSTEVKSPGKAIDVAPSSDKTVESTALRIPPCDDASKEKDTPAVPTEEPTSPPPQERRHTDYFVSRLRASFPSAFRLVDNNATQGLFPFITLHHQSSINNNTNTNATSTEELISTLDALFASLSPDTNETISFWTKPSSLSWIENLRATVQPSMKVPLYMIFLLRFQAALFQSYEKVLLTATESNKTDSDTPKESGVVDDTKVPKQNILLNKEVSPSSTFTYSRSFPQLQSRLVEISSKVNEANELLAPLSLCFAEFADETATVCDAFIMPLGILMRRMYDTDATVDDSFRMIDQAVKETLDKVNSSLESPPAKSPPQEPTATATAKVDDPNSSEFFDSEKIAAEIEAMGSDSPPQSKKSAKRRNRRKKRKGIVGSDQQQQPQLRETKDANVQTDEMKPAKVADVAVTDVAEVAKVAEVIVDPPVPTVPSVEEEITTVSLAQSQDTSDSDDESVAQVSTSEQDEDEKKDHERGLLVSRMEGVGPTCVVVATQETEGVQDEEVTGENENTDAQQPPTDGNDDDWETVEVKSRGGRKKNFGNNKTQGYQVQGSKKNKLPRSKATRKRAENRKMVREILSTVLDGVDDEVRKRVRSRTWRESSQAAPPTQTSSVWASANGAKGNLPHQQSKKGPNQGAELSMRDVLLGRESRNTNIPTSMAAKISSGTTAKKSPMKQKSSAPKTSADQNTAPTLPETLSVPQRSSGITRSESSSGGSIEASKQQQVVPGTAKDDIHSPPLPTLLSPGNVNSASSSVASSLEAPNGHRRSRSHKSSAGNENDVGYHLLNVCDSLTRDIASFMKARQAALHVRRRERREVLVALQASLTSIWPGMCNVEMYGSCATDLDLPSSDLDVVVRGLDESHDIVSGHGDSEMHALPETPEGTTSSVDDSSGTPSKTLNTSSDSTMYSAMSPNGDRVVRLAMDLERQPWAVHVKAIPTASVPVIKILADPAKLPGSDEVEKSDSNTTHNPLQHIHNAQATPLWRGADVVNGLLKVDITFEGPEHGGIGSTVFSSKVVQDFGVESGQSPNDTAFVQVLMVLKELLAQRRLNEPFLGGMSSYGLLLLLVSVVREREMIREELERVERQRRMVAAGGGSVPRLSIDPSALTASKQTNGDNSWAPKGETRTKPGPTNGKGLNLGKQYEQPTKQVINQPRKSNIPENKTTKPKKEDAGPAPKKATPVPSSWASIAMNKKTTPSTSIPATQNRSATVTKAETKRAAGPTPTKITSFADAVARGKQSSNGKRENLPPTQKRVEKSKPVKSSVDEKKTSDSITDHTAVTVAVSSPRQTEKPRKENPKGPTNSYEAASWFPQSFHDVIEVLSSGETTPGKLLMHFLLFYGQHFDSQSTAIDYSGTHDRDSETNNGYSIQSSYMQRRTAGSFDPMTGMLTVDPIVVYDPLEGAEMDNVARSCFLWSSIRWVFAQSYMTLSSAVEMSAGLGTLKNHTNGQGQDAYLAFNGGSDSQAAPSAVQSQWTAPFTTDDEGNIAFDPTSPILELLLSF